MRARIPTQLTKKQKTAIRENVAIELKRQGQDTTRRMFKLLCAVLNEEYGFGRSRLMVVIDSIRSLAEEHDHDEVFWHHIDTLMDQIGVPFEKENYDEVDR